MQIFIGSTSLDVIDLYPDDLPAEWRFDYYYNAFDALRLDCDTDEDLDEILENIEDDFQLIIDISNTFNLPLLIEKTKVYRDNVIIVCNSDEHLAALEDMRYVVKGEVTAGTQLSVLGNTITYNEFPVVFIDKPSDEKHMRSIIEELLPLNQDLVILIDNADSETLEKMKIIADLLL